MPPTRGRISTSFAPSVCATASAVIGTLVDFNEITLTGMTMPAPCGAASSFLPQATNPKLVTAQIIRKCEKLGLALCFRNKVGIVNSMSFKGIIQITLVYIQSCMYII